MSKSTVPIMLTMMVLMLFCIIPSAAATDPHITVDQSVSPADIYLKGDGGTPDTAKVTLSIVGAGDPVAGGEKYMPADIVFCVDDTGSMGGVISQAQAQINAMTDILSTAIPNVRFGLVTYKDNSERDIDLTSDVGAFKAKVNALSAYGGDDYEEGVQLGLSTAQSSSWRTGDAAKVIILIGDAPPHSGDISTAIGSTNQAFVENGVYTNVIACSTSDPAFLSVFQQIAAAGHGTFAVITNPSAVVDGIITSIKTVVPSIDTAGNNVVVKAVLPDYMEASNFDPAPTTSDGNVYTWDFGTLGIGATKTIAYDVKCTAAGDNKLVNNLSILTYNAWGGSDFTVPTTIPFADLFINCKTSVVADTEPPVITPSGKQVSLWAPNHKYSTVKLSDLIASVIDAGDPTVDLSKVVITSVSSDEKENSGGDGNTLSDIVIKDSQTVDLRAERDGSGNGRVYTINYKVSDASGNTATGSSQVWVPHDQGEGSTAIDDGAAAGYTVNFP